MSEPIYAPPVNVTGPTPMPKEFGLYSVATITDSNDSHAQGGVQYDPLSCGAVATVSAACGTPGGPAMPGTAELTPDRWVHSSAFMVYAGPQGRLVSYRPDELLTKAQSWLRLGEEAAVERGFWTGASLTDDPAALHLTAGDAAAGGKVEVLAAAAVSPKLGIGLLEEALGDRLLGRGVIHAPRVAIPFLPDLFPAGTRLQTKLHTDVAAGSGYDGSGPDGAARAAGEAWLYGTGPVKVTRGEAFEVGGDDVGRLLDRTTNEITVLSGRLVTVTYECALVGVRITLN